MKKQFTIAVAQYCDNTPNDYDTLNDISTILNEMKSTNVFHTVIHNNIATREKGFTIEATGQKCSQSEPFPIYTVHFDTKNLAEDFRSRTMSIFTELRANGTINKRPEIVSFGL